MSDKLMFYYLGDDEAYFRNLRSEYQRSGKAGILLTRFGESSENKIQSLFIKIFKDRPDCVFIDFSKNTQDYLHLARLIARTPLEHKPILVGLLDILSPPEILKEGVATGTHLNFIKGAETFDLVFETLKLLSPESSSEHGFASAALKEDWEAGIPCKVGFIEETGVHIESDVQLSKGDRIVLDNFWFNSKIVASRHGFVKEVSTSNMFYHYKQNADIDFLFIDDFIPPEGMTEEEVKFKNAEREAEVATEKEQLKMWLQENKKGSVEKRAKLLVVDYEFNIYQDQVRTDKFPFTIRCIPSFSDIDLELDRLRPQIIAYRMDAGETAKNTLEVLRKLSTTLLGSTFSGLNTYLVVFNTELKSAELQAALQYPRSLAHQEEISSEVLIKLASMLQKKISSEENVESADSLDKVYLSKANPASVAEIIKTFTVIKLSETDLIIQSEWPIPSGTNLHFRSPVNMYVNMVQNPKPSGKIPEFIGLIHGVTEEGKKELRRYVNSIFFRDHDAQQAAELEEYKKINQAKLLEKMAAEEARKAEEAKKLEEAQKAAKEKLAKKAEEAAAKAAQEAQQEASSPVEETIVEEQGKTEESDV